MSYKEYIGMNDQKVQEKMLNNIDPSGIPFKITVAKMK